MPTEYSEDVIFKTYKAPDREIYYQPIVETKIVNTVQEPEFVKQEEEIRNKTPIQRKAIEREVNRVETITVPGREIQRETYVQPIIQNEKVDLRIS